MATIDQAQAALRDYKSMIGEAYTLAFGIGDEFKSINQSSPEALAQLKVLREKWKAGAAEYNPKIAEFNSRLVELGNALPPGPDRTALIADYNQTRSQLSGLFNQLKSLSAQIGQSITTLEKAAEEKTKTEEPAAPPEKPKADVSDDAEKSKSAANAEDAAATNAAAPQNPVAPASSNSPYTTPTRPNPLGNLSSYTYGLSLYMVNSAVANNFIAGGGTMAGITGNTPGVRVVAQSGGLAETDKALLTINGQRIEYYIDDLNLTTFLPGGTQRAIASTEIKFKVIEPVGFAFLQDLTRAGFALNKESNIVAPNMNGIQQHFIFGIKFYGYDVNGNVINQPPSNPKGGNSAPDALPERYFIIKITKIKFKLDGKIVTYQFDAVVLSESIANGQVNGIVKTATTLTGATVGDILANTQNKTSLVSVLNSMGETSKDNKQVQIPVKYAIEFLDKAGNIDANSVIAKQKLMNDATFDNKLSSTFKASSTEKATIAAQFKANIIDKNSTSVQLTNGQNILTVIDNIITKSEYITSTLDSISKSEAETKTQPNPVSKTFTWYSVNPVVKVNKVDAKTNNWSYEITLQIKPFDVPYVRLVTASVTSTYPGPSKRYDYWLTGLNSEIISYEQQYDNLYYVATVMSRGQNEQQNSTGGSAPQQVQNATGADSTGSENKLFQYNENAVAQIYSPGDQSRAKIKILGDPDYIMTSTGVNGARTLGRSNFQIDPLNGQVFIEISFKMASDYQSNGLLDVSGNIQFYGAAIMDQLKIKGVVYKVIRVDSVFAKGTFTQTLDCVLVDQTMLTKPRTKEKTPAVEGRPITVMQPSDPSRNNIRGGPTAEELAANNRPPPSVDLRTPQSSLAKGVQSILNPAGSDNPSLSQLQSSKEYIAARRAGETAPRALNIAREAIRANFNRDDQFKNSQAQQPASTNDGGRPRGGR